MQPPVVSVCPCGDPSCQIRPVLSLDQFSRHRPKAHRGLLLFLQDNAVDPTAVKGIMPEYAGERLFSACIDYRQGSVSISGVAVLVSIRHPIARRERESPGSPTWWWEGDIEDSPKN